MGWGAFGSALTTEGTVDSQRATGLDDETPETIYQAQGVKVHQQANADTAHAQVCQDLGVVDGCQSTDRLYFDDDFVFCHDVGSESFVEFFALEYDRNRCFSPVTDPRFGHFIADIPDRQIRAIQDPAPCAR